MLEEVRLAQGVVVVVEEGVTRSRCKGKYIVH